MNERPHRRYNPLLDEWVLVSPHRTKRPWQGQRESSAIESLASHDPQCYLCPGSLRAGGAKNPDYDSVYVFANDFAALLPEQEEATLDDGLLKARSVSGESRVICFSPRHDLTLPRMEVAAIGAVVGEWRKQADELKGKYEYVQIFENKGAVMGCSNPHPHGQIWAGNFLPNYPLREEANQKEYFRKKSRNLLRDYADLELKAKTRIVVQNEDWLAVVPYWAVWPFETMLLPLFEARDLVDLREKQAGSLALILKDLLIRYDNLFLTSFPYSMGWHQSPAGRGKQEHLLLHAHFYPPLLRSAEVKKFMVGYEMLAESQRDILPETAAEMLRSLHSKHYTAKD